VIKLDKCKWLPEIIECKNFSEWNEYLDGLYKIFQKDFVEDKIFFEGKQVNYRRAPKDGKYENAFIHLTHNDELHNSKDPNDRVPDPKRAARIGWNKPIIEHYPCNESCENCEKILYFEEYNGKNVKAYFLFKDVRFLVIIEKRKKYNLFLTGFYIEYDNVLEKNIKKYEKYKKQKTPLT
jgi:hypothetical protein